MIKLVATSRRIDGKIFARVCPVIINRSHPLANVEDVFNAIVVKGDAIGDAMFYGRGAGKLPTASAVVADIIDIVTHAGTTSRNMWKRVEGNNLSDISESKTSFFVRVTVRNREEAGKYIVKTFGEIAFIKINSPETENELAFTTTRATEGELKEKVAALKGIGSIKDVVNVIRIQEY